MMITADDVPQITGMGGFIHLDNLAMYKVTLRDYFAAKAMVMLHDEDGFMEITAKLAYEMADEMIEARKVK